MSTQNCTPHMDRVARVLEKLAAGNELLMQSQNVFNQLQPPATMVAQYVKYIAGLSGITDEQAPAIFIVIHRLL